MRDRLGFFIIKLNDEVNGNPETAVDGYEAGH